MKNKGIIGIFSTDWQMADAIRRLREKNIPVADAFTPFISHEIMNQLGRESRLPYISVAAGAGTIIMVLSFLHYTAVIDYPLVYGGKPFFAFPSFVVVTYLLTILITFILTVAAFQGRTGIIPGRVITEPLHRAGAEGFIEGLSDDKFMIILGGKEDLGADMKESATAILREAGATEIIEIKS
jgi:hypothetical protein